MAELSVKFTELFWQAALGLVPLAMAVGLVIRLLPCRPATRHTLWLTLTVWLLVSPWLPTPPQFPVLDWQGTPELALVDHESIASVPAITPITHDLYTENPSAQSTTDAPADEFADELIVETWSTNSHQADKALEPLVDAIWTANESATIHRTKPDRAEFPEPRARPKENEASFSRSAARPVLDSMDMLARGTGAGGLHSDLSLYETAEQSDPARPIDDLLNLPREQTVPAPDTTISANSVDRSIQHQNQNQNQNSPAVLSVSITQEKVISPTHGLLNSLTTGIAAWCDRILAYGAVLPAWISAATTVRDAILTLPPIPIVVWASGLALVVAIKLGSLVYFLRRVRASADAPQSVLDLVRDTSKQLGLKNPPKTLMTEAKISPMVWSGRRPLLILPRALWQQLDRESKRAVICHELAHIRRKDHWVAWLETVVGAVYWWHPVVWWVRSRLHVEAENCCDAWVTWLFPSERRAYAGALLATKKYIGMNESRAPVAGMQMTSGRAGRFARRLTMVMTQSIVPRLSVPGLALAVALALSSWLTATAWSYPDEAASVKAVETIEAEKLASDEQAPSVVIATTPESDAASQAGDSSHSSYTYVVTSQDQKPSDPGQANKTHTGHGQPYVVVSSKRHRKNLERRLDELERQLAKLTGRLNGVAVAPATPLAKVGHCKNCAKGSDCKKCSSGESCDSCAEGASCSKCAKSFGRGGSSATVGSTGKCGSCAKTRHHRSHSRSFFGHTDPPQTPEVRPHRHPRSPRPPREHRGHVFFEYVSPDAETPAVPHGIEPLLALGLNSSFTKYELSKGKLEALTKLMSRSDVPIIIRPGHDAIAVQGGPAVQNMFKSFVSLIEPGEETVVEYKLSKGKLNALIELMSRSDIPVLIEATNQGIEVHGQALQQSAFAAFVDAINGSNGNLSTLLSAPWPEITKREKAEKRAKRHRHKKEVHAHKSKVRKFRYAEKLAKRSENRARRSSKRELRRVEKQIRKAQRERHLQGRLRDRALRRHLIEEKVQQSKRGSIDLDSLHKQLAELMAEIPSQEISDSIKQALQDIKLKGLDFHKQRDMIETQARKLEEQARAMAQRAVEFAEKAQGLESKSDELDSQADELGDLTEELHRDLEQAKDDDIRAKVLAEHAALLTQADTLQHNIHELESHSEELADDGQDLEDQSQAYAMLAEFLLDTAQSFFDQPVSK